MPALNEKPVRLLMRDMTASMNLEPGQMFSKIQAIDWFKHNYPNIKEGTVDRHLTRMSTNAPGRLHHDLTSDGSDDLLFKVDSNRFRLYDRTNDPPPITSKASLESNLTQIDTDSEVEVELEAQMSTGLAGFIRDIDGVLASPECVSSFSVKSIILLKWF